MTGEQGCQILCAPSLVEHLEAELTQVGRAVTCDYGYCTVHDQSILLCVLRGAELMQAQGALLAATTACYHKGAMASLCTCAARLSAKAASCPPTCLQVRTVPVQTLAIDLSELQVPHRNA